jgi:GT2 family glycosyltransferase
MTIGICSLWWNHQELLPEFLRMMKVGGWDKLILVDNASSPEAHEAYRKAIVELGPKASGLRMSRNSVLHAWNAGMAALGTDILIQMANDVIMTNEKWLEWAVEGIGPGIIQGPICWFRGMVYVDGSMCVVWREDWEKLGGLDAEYYAHPGYWSDTDLCFRAQQKGMTVRPTRCGILHLINYSGGNGAKYNAPNGQNAEKFVGRYLEPVNRQCPVVLQGPVLQSQPEVESGSSNPIQPERKWVTPFGPFVRRPSERGGSA